MNSHKKNMIVALLMAGVVLPVCGQENSNRHERKKANLEHCQALYKQGECSCLNVWEAQAALLRAEIAEQKGADSSRIIELQKNYAQQLYLATATEKFDKALEVRQRMLTLQNRDYAALTAPVALEDIELLREHTEYHRSLYEHGLESALIYLRSEHKLTELQKNQLAVPAKQ